MAFGFNPPQGSSPPKGKANHPAYSGPGYGPVSCPYCGRRFWPYGPTGPGYGYGPSGPGYGYGPYGPGYGYGPGRPGYGSGAEGRK